MLQPSFVFCYISNINPGDSYLSSIYIFLILLISINQYDFIKVYFLMKKLGNKNMSNIFILVLHIQPPTVIFEMQVSTSFDSYPSLKAEVESKERLICLQNKQLLMPFNVTLLLTLCMNPPIMNAELRFEGRWQLLKVKLENMSLAGRLFKQVTKQNPLNSSSHEMMGIRQSFVRLKIKGETI